MESEASKLVRADIPGSELEAVNRQACTNGEDSETGIVEAALHAKGTSFAAEISRIGNLARVCGLKGLVSALPRAAVCAPLHAQSMKGSSNSMQSQGAHEPIGRADALQAPAERLADPGSSGQWCFISNGVLPLACDAIMTAQDAHFKFHAVHLLSTCLQRMKDLIEV
jgi:hypothetical protein